MGGEGPLAAGPGHLIQLVVHAERFAELPDADEVLGQQARRALAVLERCAVNPAVTKRMAGCTTDSAVVLLGRETIYRDGERVGWLSSAGFGYTIDRSIGYGYVRHRDGVTTHYVLDGTYELEVATERVPCAVSLQPFYDPRSERVRS